MRNGTGVTVYRSPNVKIDDAIWHVKVMQYSDGRRGVVYRWRLSPRHMWTPASEWRYGTIPKGFWKFFRPFRSSIRIAMVAPL